MRGVGGKQGEYDQNMIFGKKITYSRFIHFKARRTKPCVKESYA